MGCCAMVKKYITDVHCVGLIRKNFMWCKWTHKTNCHFLFNRRSDYSGGGGEDENNSKKYYLILLINNNNSISERC